MSDGKELERIITLVENVYKTLPETKIFRNHKVANVSGNIREIDVYIESSINGYTIKVAIECKDWANPVPVEKIEAFNSKCSRIEGISKKVFVSRSGYQKDAIAAAEDFNIELYTANKLDNEAVLKWFPIKQLGLIKYLPYLDVKLNCNLQESEIEEFRELNTSLKLSFQDGTIKTVQEILEFGFTENHKYFWNIAIYNWMKNKESQWDEVKVPFELAFKPSLKLSLNSSEILVSEISAFVRIQLSEKESNIIDVREVMDEVGKSRARTIQIDFGNGTKGDVILDPTDQASFFVQDELGNHHKLRRLYGYDPETDSFS